MRFCDNHWAKLKTAIEERGMGKYVSKDSQSAVQSMMEGRPDPLIAAHNAIVQNAFEVIGFALMLNNADHTERCPICYTSEQARDFVCECGRPDCTPDQRAKNVEDWIDAAADAQLERISGARRVEA